MTPQEIIVVSWPVSRYGDAATSETKNGAIHGFVQERGWNDDVYGVKAEIDKDPPQCDDPGERMHCTSLEAARLDSERSCGRCLTIVQKGRSPSDLALCRSLIVQPPLLTVQLRK